MTFRKKFLNQHWLKSPRQLVSTIVCLGTVKVLQHLFILQTETSSSKANESQNAPALQLPLRPPGSFLCEMRGQADAQHTFLFVSPCPFPRRSQPNLQQLPFSAPLPAFFRLALLAQFSMDRTAAAHDQAEQAGRCGQLHASCSPFLQLHWGRFRTDQHNPRVRVRRA